MKKTLFIVIGAYLLSLFPFQAFAGWKVAEQGWRWQNDDGSYAANGWKWIDSDNDGASECYYFNDNAYLLQDTTTPDGHTVNADGAWIQNGVVIIQRKYQNIEEWTIVHKELLDLIARYSDENNEFKACECVKRLDFEHMPNDVIAYTMENSKVVLVSKYDESINAKTVYYGTMVNGVKTGYGFMYAINRDDIERLVFRQYDYYIFKGQWKNDAPNGYGEEFRRFSPKSGQQLDTLRLSGNYENWYETGERERIFTNRTGTTFVFHYNMIDKYAPVLGREMGRNNDRREVTIVSYADGGGMLMTFYGSAQTALNKETNDGIFKNNYGYYRN